MRRLGKTARDILDILDNAPFPYSLADIRGDLISRYEKSITQQAVHTHIENFLNKELVEWPEVTPGRHQARAITITRAGRKALKEASNGSE